VRSTHVEYHNFLDQVTATLLDECNKLRSKSILLGVCTACHGLQTELVETNARIALLEKASSVSAPTLVQCALCEGLQSALESYDTTRPESRKKMHTFSRS
jgi:hypothetical protein